MAFCLPGYGFERNVVQLFQLHDCTRHDPHRERAENITETKDRFVNRLAEAGDFCAHLGINFGIGSIRSRGV
jgi:hypothetical protein